MSNSDNQSRQDAIERSVRTFLDLEAVVDDREDEVDVDEDDDMGTIYLIYEFYH